MVIRKFRLKFVFFILIIFLILTIVIYLFLIDIHHYYKLVNFFGARIKLYEESSIKNYFNKNPTIFCLIKTHPNNIRINKTITAYNVWARKCDNYRFTTLLPEEFIPKDVNTNQTIEIFNQFFMIQPEGLHHESHSDLSLKIYHSVKYVYKNFPNYDWFHIVDDDAYVNIKNFKRFLRDKNPKNLVTYGHNFKVEGKEGFHSGGPGYVLSNAAFTKLGKILTTNMPFCPNTGTDDVDLQVCLRDLNIFMGKSLDEQKRERFLNLGILDHFLGNYTLGHFIYSQNPPKKGFDCCSDSLVAVHYMRPQNMYLFDLAMNSNQEIINFNGKILKLNQPNTFKNIILNYVLLLDAQDNSIEFKNFLELLKKKTMI